MSAIRVPRTRRENAVQQRDATLPGGGLDPGPGSTWTRNVLAGYAAVALALILDLGRPLFRCCTALSATRSPPFGVNVALENRD